MNFFVADKRMYVGGVFALQGHRENGTSFSFLTQSKLKLIWIKMTDRHLAGKNHIIYSSYS